MKEWLNFGLKLTVGLGLGGLVAYGVTWFLNNTYLIGGGLYINF